MHFCLYALFIIPPFGIPQGILAQLTPETIASCTIAVGTVATSLGSVT